MGKNMLNDEKRDKINNKWDNKYVNSKLKWESNWVYIILCSMYIWIEILCYGNRLLLLLVINVSNLSAIV